MIETKLKTIFNQFAHGGKYESYKELASGHINDTYLIKTEKKPYFVLQRVNHMVFKDVPGLIANKVAVSLHIQEKLRQEKLPENKIQRRVLSFAKSKSSDNYYVQDEAGNYWNLMYFIKKSFTHEVVTSEAIAYEGGKLLGKFLTLTDDFDASELIEVIPKFHDMAFRYSQFEDALKLATEERKTLAKDSIDFVEASREEMHILQNLKNSGDIKLRVTHNDTKISNALFNKHDKGLCLIDTDTVMPGIVHYDFGDAIRTICSTAAEDEANLDLVNFNVAYYKAYSKGFLENMKSALTPLEIQYLPLGAKTMIFIIGLRFLTDFLNNDIYFKTKYPEHNLVRAKNQFKLVKSLAGHFNELQTLNN
ncbi:MAG: phosphotransferase enzyme family protein [Flavobacteriaceae bacterium]